MVDSLTYPSAENSEDHCTMARSAGTWKKGCSSPNPGGRPKQVAEVKELARQHTEAALSTLAAIMADSSPPPSARVSAAESLLSRGWGKPEQSTVSQVSVTSVTPTDADVVPDVQKLWLRALELAQDQRETSNKSIGNGGIPGNA